LVSIVVIVAVVVESVAETLRGVAMCT